MMKRINVFSVGFVVGWCSMGLWLPELPVGLVPWPLFVALGVSLVTLGTRR